MIKLEGWEDVLGDNHKHCGVLGLHFEPEPVSFAREIAEHGVRKVIVYNHRSR